MSAICDVCNFKVASLICPDCKSKIYCSERCGQIDWVRLSHNVECKQNEKLIGFRAQFQPSSRALRQCYVPPVPRCSTVTEPVTTVPTIPLQKDPSVDITSVGPTNVPIRRAFGTTQGTYRVVKLILDVVTLENSKPVPGKYNLQWILINNPPGAVPGALYWRAIIGTQQPYLIVKLGQRGPVSAYSGPKTTKSQLSSVAQVSTTIVPMQNKYIIYYIKEIVMTYDTDSPSILQNGIPAPDPRYGVWNGARAPLGYKFWENIGATLEYGRLGETGATIPDPTDLGGKYGRPGTGDRALETIRLRRQPLDLEPLASEINEK